MSSRASIAAGSVSGAASQSARRRAPPALTVRSMAASSEPCRSPASLRVSSRLRRVAASISMTAPEARRRRRRQPRQAAELGRLEIVDQRAAGGDLGPLEAAEAVQRLDREGLLQPPARGLAVEARRGQRRELARGIRPAAAASSGCWNSRSGSRISLGCSRASAPASSADAERLHREIAGGDIDPGEAQRPARIGDGGEVIMAAGVEQALLGQRARRHDAHHVAPDHRLGAALLGLGRILDLLADGDLEALADQLGEIALGGMHRHAAHRDVPAVMLAALGERDGERRRGLGPHPRRTARRNRPCGRTADGRDGPA